jgi:hypothetical protein
MNVEHPAMEKYLDEVSAQLGRRKGKRDVLMELKAAILDRAEDAVEKALQAMGEPYEVAHAFVGDRYLVGPRYYPAFVVYTGILFAIHLVMIIVATVTKWDIGIFPISIMRVPNPHSLINIGFVAIQALLMDIGLMVVIFTLVSRTHRTVHVPALSFRVKTGLRPSITRSVLAVLVILLLNPLRDDLFIVVLDNEVKSMFSPSFEKSLLFINLLLSLVIAKELAYAWLGEKRGMVTADGLLQIAGAALMIWFLTHPSFISFPSAVNEPHPALPTLNQLMQKAMQLILIAFAVGFSISAVKRFARLYQMWR